MPRILLASTILAAAATPALAQAASAPNRSCAASTGPTGDGSFLALPATTDVSDLLAVMKQNADIARPESGGTLAITLAPGDVTPGTGASAVDKNGNVFTLPFKGGMWGNSMGQPMENGVPIADGTGWVAAIRVVNGIACFENSKGLGWGCQGSGTWVSDPGPGDAGSSTGSVAGQNPQACTPSVTGTVTPTPKPGHLVPAAATPVAATVPPVGSRPNLLPCAVPDPAALVGYNTPVIHGPVTLGSTWQAIPGANVTQNVNGTITVAGGGSTFNNQVGTTQNISGGFYAQATLSWTGTAQWLPGNGWPAFWGTNASAGLGMTNVEADFMEAMSGADAFNGGLHNWNPDGSDTGSGGLTGGVNAVPAGTDFSQPHTYGFLSVPATATSRGHAVWFFDGKQVADIPITQGGLFSTLATEPLKIMVGSGTANPMTVYDVSVWQASAGSTSAGGPMIPAAASVVCPGNVAPPNAAQTDPLAPSSQLAQTDPSAQTSADSQSTLSIAQIAALAQAGLPSGQIIPAATWSDDGGNNDSLAQTAALAVDNGAVLIGATGKPPAPSPQPTDVAPVIRTADAPSGTSSPPQPVSNSISYSLTGNYQTSAEPEGNGTGTVSGMSNTLIATGGIQTINVTGIGNTVTTGPYNDTVTVSAGGNTIDLGGGSNTIVLAYPGETPNTPTNGAPLPPLAGSGNVFMAPALGTGTLTIQGTLAKGDKIDVTKALVGLAGYTGTNMWNYLTVSTSPTGAVLSVQGKPIVTLPAGVPNGNLGKFIQAEQG